MTAQNAVRRLKELDKEIQLLAHTLEILGWDEDTKMPKKAVGERSEQISLVSGLLHNRIVAPEIGELLGEAQATGDNPLGDPALERLDRAFLRAVHRRYTRETRLPEKLVTEFAGERSRATAVWRQARADNDFSRFAPYLKRLVELTREQAECVGYEDHLYDALIDEYEPGMKSAEVRRVFEPLAKQLSDLVARIDAAPQVETSFLENPFPVSGQEEFSRYLLEQLDFPSERGRLDVSAHPFTTTLGFDDVRITTRYREDYLPSSIFSTIHETGHALYELGFPEELRGTLLAAGTSLGIHESQSRTWENVIGKSRPFWEAHFPELKRLFPSQLDRVSAEQFYRAVNKVEPSLIRTDADEVTYSLHIVLRFELELLLLTGSLSVDEAPEAWNERMKKLLGVCPDSDANGVLQDTHWAGGQMGYFPTYALGNLYGAQFSRQMRIELPDLDDDIASGDLQGVLDWLRKNIHEHGAARTASELCEKVSGEPLNPQYFIDYLENKFGTIYDL